MSDDAGWYAVHPVWAGRLAADLTVDERRAAQRDGGVAIGGRDLHRAVDLLVAAEAGADYVAFGAFFPSATKLATKYRATPDLLRDWSETTVVPSCAIGGITAQNCEPLVEAGADFLAVIGAVWSHPRGPGEAVREFNAVLPWLSYPGRRNRLVCAAELGFN